MEEHMGEAKMGLPSLLEKKVDTSWQDQKEMALQARDLGKKLRKGKPISFQRTIGRISL